MNLNKFMKEATKLRNFRIDRSLVEDSLRMILEKQPIDLWDMLKTSDEDFEAIVAIVMNLKEQRLIKVSKNGKFSLTPKGNTFAKSLNVVPTPKAYKSRYSFPIPKPMRKILKKMKKIYKEINPKDEFEQGSLRPEASIRKISYAISRGDIAGKNVVCVGDDDLLSLIMGMTGLPKSILMLDIDRDLIALVNKHKKSLKVPIKTHFQNLYNPIPKNLRGKYDVFMTQPPDTVLGYTLFLSRGVELLKKQPGMIGYGGLTPTACPRLALIDIQQIIVKMGLVQTDYVHKFCEYPPLRTEIKKVEVPKYIPYPPTKLWYVSDLQRLKTTINTKPYYTGPIRGDIADYKADQKKYAR